MNKLKILKIGTLVSVVILVAAIIACQSMDYTSSAYQLPYAFVWIGFFMLVIFAFAWGVIANKNAPEEHIEVVTPSKDVYNDTAKKYAISLTTPISSYNEESKSDEIALPYGTEEIEDGAFKDCTNLKIILIPDSVTSIGKSAFENCTKLESILIPYGVTSVGEFAFDGCENLKSITIPESVTSIGFGAFKNCTKLESITIPDSVTSIGNSTFAECTKLESILIPDSVTSIKGSAFVNCTNLKSITLPRKATIAGELWFLGCKNLESITIPDGVKSIGKRAFENCTKLESITIPDSVLIIANSAFAECTNLKSITIPDSVVNIGESAFSDCTNLENILIPDSVKSIGKRAFENCIKLESITIPDSVLIIGESAFSDCTNLENILIPDSVKSIGGSAFGNCTNLTRIIGISGSFAEKYAKENYFQFQSRANLSNKIQSDKPLSTSFEIVKNKTLMQKKAGEAIERELKKPSASDNIISESQTMNCIPFLKSMNVGIHHITEGVQRIEVMNLWTIDVPTGYEFSLDFEHTGKAIGGINRPLVIMIDDGHSSFLNPYNSKINFVVFSTRGVEFHGQPLNSSDSHGIISEINEDVRRSTRKYKAMVETELINVQYLIITNKKEDSEFFISIFTQEDVFFAQFIFNEPELEKNERIKMVEDWMRTIKPITNGYNVQKNKGGRPNECGDNTTRTLTRNTSVEKANDTTDNFFEETVNTLNELRVLGDNLDEAGIGVKAIFDIPYRTRDLINIELGEFMLYLAHVNGDITDREAALLYIVMGDNQDCDKYSLSQIVSRIGPKPDNLYSLGAFLGADYFSNRGTGTKNTRTTDRLIQLYEKMASIIAACAQRANPAAEKMKMEFLNGMKTYVKENL